MSEISVKLPALRGRQGERTLYVVLPDNNTLNSQFSDEVEPHDDRSQRALNPAHARAIASYIIDNPSEYIVGAITYAMDTEGIFEPAYEGSAMGVLSIAQDAKLRSIDGQHRRYGIREVMHALPYFGHESTALLLYVEDDLTRRRQMFSDMNWTPRKVSASQNIAFDSRDPFSRAVQRLVRLHPLLAGRVELELAQVRRDSAQLFTLGAVYAAVRRLHVGQGGKLRSYSGFDEDDIIGRAERFFTILGQRPELREGLTADQLTLVRSQSILPSSTVLKVVAGAVHSCIDYHRAQESSFRIEDITNALLVVSFAPSGELWQNSGLISPGSTTPNARNQEVRQATNLLAARLLGV